MMRIFFTKDYWTNPDAPTSTLYRAGIELDVEDEIARLAVLSGCAQVASFAAYELSEPVEIPDDFYDEDEAE